jgi:hypothetical protein
MRGLYMRTFLALVLVILSFLSYLFLSPQLNFYQYHPIVHYLGMAVGILLLIRLIKKEFTKLRLAAIIMSLLIVGFTFWYTLSFSEYSDTKSTIAAGDISDERLKQIILVSATGKSINLGEIFINNRATLIVLNRGAW